MMQRGKLPAGARVRFHLGDYNLQEGTVTRSIGDFGYAVLPETGRRVRVPSEYVKGVPAH